MKSGYVEGAIFEADFAADSSHGKSRTLRIESRGFFAWKAADSAHGNLTPMRTKGFGS